MSLFADTDFESEPIPLDPNHMVDHADFVRLEKKVDKIIETFGRLVLFEDRQVNQSAAIQKLEKDISYLQGLNTALERKVDQWINRGIGAWFIAGLVFAGAQFYLSHVGK